MKQQLEDIVRGRRESTQVVYSLERRLAGTIGAGVGVREPAGRPWPLRTGGQWAPGGNASDRGWRNRPSASATSAQTGPKGWCSGPEAFQKIARPDQRGGVLVPFDGKNTHSGPRGRGVGPEEESLPGFVLKSG